MSPRDTFCSRMRTRPVLRTCESSMRNSRELMRTAPRPSVTVCSTASLVATRTYRHLGACSHCASMKLSALSAWRVKTTSTPLTFERERVGLSV